MTDQSTTSDVVAVVLAGGASTRFGDEPKATATLGGRPIVARVVTRVRAATDRRPVVAAGPTQKRAVVDDALSRPVRYAADAEWCTGPLAGICGALSSVSAPTVFLCGCDMPLVSVRAVAWLVDHHRSTDYDATVPVDTDGRFQPLHGVYQTEALADYCAGTPDCHRLRSVVSDLSTDIVAPTTPPDELDLLRSMANANTRAELDELEASDRRAAGRRSAWTEG